MTEENLSLSKSATTASGPGAFPSRLSAALVKKERLNVERIKEHEARIAMAVREGRETWIPVLSACTATNGGIVAWKTAVRFLEGEKSESERRFDNSLLGWWCENHVVTFIPAAGAASRYLGQLHKFATDVEGQVQGLAGLFEKAWTGSSPLALENAERSAMLDALEGLTPTGDFLRLAEHLRSLRAGGVRDDYRRTLLGVVEALTTGTSQAAGKAADSKLGKVIELPSEGRSQGKDDAGELRRPWRRSMRPRGASFRRAPQATASSASRGGSRTVASHLSPAAYQTLDAYAAARACLKTYGGSPKAFVPTTEEGDTFLRLKLVEQASLLPSRGNFLVAPAEMGPRFEEEIAREGERLKGIYVNPFELGKGPFAPRYLRSEEDGGGQARRGVWKVLEQGRDLCTIRFQKNGDPYVGPDGNYSVVSAGHGELLHLFDDVARDFPEAECLHLRNIDNIIGTTGERCEELSVPADLFRIVRDCLEYVRALVDDFIDAGAHTVKDARLVNPALVEIFECLAVLLGPTARDAKPEDVVDASGRFVGFTAPALHKLFRQLFHWPALPEAGEPAARWREIREQLGKPLSVFGVVRKETGDVGGGPVFVETPDGKRVKICLEMPHASPEDSAEYFGPRGKATHFNPVLVFFELRTHKRAFEGGRAAGRMVDFGRLFDDRFWLLSKKEHQGTSVCYHETVLYELIGNSATTNLLFVEVPRTLFVPHKTIFDSMGQDRRSYGFHETLKELEGTP